MQLELTDREAETLREMLRDSLPSLQREIARTERHALRHELTEREQLVEKLLDRLPTGVR